MKKKEKQNSISSRKKIEKILGYKMISEFNPLTRKYFSLKLYSVLWEGYSEPRWEKETDLSKFKHILNEFDKLNENKETDDIPNGQDISTSLYNEYNMRLDENFISYEKNSDLSMSKSIKTDSEKEEKNKPSMNCDPKKNINNNNKINDSEIEITEIIEIDENKPQSEEKRKNIKRHKKKSRKKNNKNVNLNKNFTTSSDYKKFGPSFNEVMNANGTICNKNEINKVNEMLLNKKRKKSDETEFLSVYQDIDENAESKTSKNSDDLKNYKISKILVPSDTSKNISIIFRNKIKDENLFISKLSNAESIPKDELLKCYENIIKTNINKISKEELIRSYEEIIIKFLAGNSYNFD